MKKEICELFDTENTKFYTEICEYDGGKAINFLIESNGYKGHGPYHLLKDDVEKYVSQLNKMSETFCGECSINDTESVNSIKIFFKGRELLLKVQLVIMGNIC